MTRQAAFGLLLLVGLLVGLTLEPDSGTPASLGLADVTGATVGANHAKPLPRITTVADVARTTVLTLIVTMALTFLVQVGIMRAAREDGRPRSSLWARPVTQRGPPAFLRG